MTALVSSVEREECGVLFVLFESQQSFVYSSHSNYLSGDHFLFSTQLHFTGTCMHQVLTNHPYVV